MHKRILISLLVVCMLVTYMPPIAFAGDETVENGNQAIQEIDESNSGTSNSQTNSPTDVVGEQDEGTPQNSDSDPKAKDAEEENDDASIGDEKFETLEEAVRAAKSGDTIKLLKDASGNGIGLYESASGGKIQTKNITIDFGGFVYTIDGSLQGSTGTVSQAFHLEKGCDVTLRNGTIKSVNVKTAMLVQNYCNLTLEHMTLDGSNLKGTKPYTLSNNNGNTTISDTRIIAPNGGVAFDVCGFMTYEGPSVTVGSGSVIDGDVEISNSGSSPHNVSLTIQDGANINGLLLQDIETKDNLNLSVVKGANVSLMAPDGYRWDKKSDGNSVLIEGTAVYVAQAGEKKYESLAEAVKDTKSGTITLLKDSEGEGIFVGAKDGKDIVIDLGGHTYSVTSNAVGSRGTETQGFHLEKDNKITIKNGTVTSVSGIGVKMLIQNYCDLTLESVVVDGTKLDGANSYALSNNNGIVVLNGTTINAKTDGVAFDVCGYADYAGAKVTVKSGSTINGAIELSSNAKSHELALTIEEDAAVNGELRIAGGGDKVETKKAASVTLEAPAEAYCWSKAVSNIQTLGKHHMELVDTQDATCTETGLKTFKCSNCGEIKTELIKALGHKDVTHNSATDANCTKSGNVENWYCGVCGNYYEDAKLTKIIDADKVVIPAPGHKLIHVDAKAATCDKDGNKEYWYCDECGKNFADDKGTTVITRAQTVIKAKEHTLTAHEAKDATCTVNGNIAYWTCDVCGKHFQDEKGTTAIAKNDTIVPKLGHDMTFHKEKAATCEEAGVQEYWTCDTCGEKFTDSKGTHKVTDDELAIQALGHNYVDGKCTYCGDVKPFKVASEDGVSYFKTLEEAIDAGAGTKESPIELIAEGGDYELQPDKKLYVVLSGHALNVTAPEGMNVKATEKDGVTLFEISIGNAADEIFGDEKDVRYFGDNRYQTALKVADALLKAKKVEKFDNIVVAYGDNFADALSGGYLANKVGAPIILVNGGNEKTISTYVKGHLASGGTVFILGGEGVVSKSFEDGVRNSGIKVERLGGADRYATNLAILKRAGVTSEELMVCSGAGFADSLSASATARPILLVANTLNSAQKNFLSERATSHFYIVGGTGAVSEGVESELAAIYGSKKITRLAGANRYDTSKKVAETFFKDAMDAVVFTYATNFPDGLSGSALAMEIGAPLILTDDSVTGVNGAKEYVSQSGAGRSVTLGGKALIADKSVTTMMGR